MSARSFLFAGGGTGGHIYPALAIAEELLDLDPSLHVEFACSTRAIDAQVLSGAALRDQPPTFTPIPAQPLGLRPRALRRFLGSWGPSVRAVRARLRAMPNPTLVAMGGFVAAPAAQAARAQRAPVVLVNLDAVPGKANRWIGSHAGRAYSAARVDRPGWNVVPPIVRRGARAPGTPEHCRESLGLAPGKPTLLVTGASQGAASINHAVVAWLESLGESARAWQVIHQTGAGAEDGVRAAYERLGIHALVREFLSPMGPAWGAASLAVARCGAGTVGEAWANAVPAIFLPYPHHRDQHQRLNALPLVECGGAVLVEDLVDPARTVDRLRAHDGLLLEPGALGERRRALESLGPADGSIRVARGLLEGP